MSIDRDERAEKAQREIVHYLKEHPDEILEAAQHTDNSELTVKRWLSGGRSLGGLVTILQEGFLRKKGVIPSLPSNGLSPSLALEKGISERVITVEEILQEFPEATTQKILQWSWEERPPQAVILLRLEWFLQNKKLRKMYRWERYTPEVKALALMLVERRITIEELAVSIRNSTHNILYWLNLEAKPGELALQNIRRMMAEGAPSQTPEHAPVVSPKPVRQGKEAEEIRTTIRKQSLVETLLSDHMEVVLALGEHFIQGSSKEQRKQFRDRNPDLAFKLSNIVSAMCSEEAYKRYKGGNS